MIELARRAVELRVGLGDVDLPQRDLAVRPGHFEGAVGEAPVLVFLGQLQAGGAALADAGDQVERDRLRGSSVMRWRMATMGSSTDPWLPESGAGVAQRLRVGHAVAAADEARAVRFVRNRSEPSRAVHRHQVQHPRRLLAARARPARAQDRLPRGHDLGLHEQVAERRMQRVRGSGGEHHFGVAGHLDGPRAAGAVGDAHPAQLDVILGRHDDLGVRVEIRVVAAEFHALLGEDRFVGFGALQRRLEGGGPDLAARRRRAGSRTCPRDRWWRPRASA